MKNSSILSARAACVSMALLLTVLGGTRSVLADDTEIFLNRPATTSDVPPNVLFVLDTSFSMNTMVAVPGVGDTPATYSTAETYESGSSGCVRGRIYWRKNDPSAEPPASCSGLPSVSATNFTCNFLKQDITASGRVYGNFSLIGANTTRIAQWTKLTGPMTNSDSWNKLTDALLPGGAERYIECERDAGSHGQSGATNPWARNGSNGPWTGDGSRQINWNSLSGEFDFFDGNYLNFYHRSPKISVSRMDILINSLDDVLEWLDQKSINLGIGLMRYSNNGATDTDGAGDGGMVIHPILPIQSTTSWTTCSGVAGAAPGSTSGKAVDSLRYSLTQRRVTLDNNSGVPQSCTSVRVMKPDGPTPMAETLWESFKYWRGQWEDELVQYGNRSRLGPGLELKSVLQSRVQPAGMDQGDVYKSPITEACGKNYTILFSDGSTNQDGSADQQIVNTLMTEKGQDAKCTPEFDRNDTSRPSDCVDDLAGWMFRNDMVDMGATDDTLQNVTTYTVGFDLKSNPDDPNGEKATNLLRRTASSGGGRFYLADSADSLVAVFTQIIREILVENVSFAAPTVTVNAFNRTQNLNELFMTVFRPSASERWKGNLKKYRIGESGDIFGQDPDFIAVDPATGFFREQAKSYWSDEVDGDDVTKGGAAAEMPTPGTDCTTSGNRVLYTNIASNDLNGTPTNCVTPTNTTLVNHLLTNGIATDTTTAQKLLSWIRGTDVDDLDEDTLTTDSRQDMGDPLHSRPVSVIYGGDATNPIGVVFTATNDGVLHAIEPGTPDDLSVAGVPNDGGNELWSFMPKELLPRLNDLYVNDARTTPDRPRSYGLDGNIRSYKTDADGDGVVEGGDVVYLFFGMRAGGNKLFGMDVTNRRDPQVMWTLGPSELPGIGETWSTPVVAKVKIGNTVRLVVVVGGGYDPKQEAYNVVTGTFDFRYQQDDLGKRIFIIDAVSGTLLWSAGPVGSGTTEEFERMANGFASDLRVIDLTADGLADRIYASDVGGRVWRFDIWNGSSIGDLVTGGVIASLGDADDNTPEVADSRRFYYAPDPSLVTGCGPAFINVAIGSGNRAWPNSDTAVQNRFYSIRDYNPYRALTQDQYDDIVPVTDDDLYLVNDDFALNDITPNVPQGGPGWRLELRTGTSWIGEKVLAESRTFANKVFFPTYTPVRRESTDACAPKFGLNKLYVVNACNAGPEINWEDQTLPPDSVSDISKTLAQGSIAPEVTFIFPSPEDENCVGRDCAPPPICLVGLESCGTGVRNRPVRTFWLQRERR